MSKESDENINIGRPGEPKTKKEKKAAKKAAKKSKSKGNRR